ncbi:MAG TPA: Ig-like domain-containing protein [Verrucomicrobiae bacterium]|nr:Ig-like domain-containing protein [Verrucomicrobiae bacterium]
MKMIFPVSQANVLFTAFCLSLVPTTSGFAQAGASNTIPVVTIRATVDHGTWAGDPAVFTVFRSGSLTPPLNVYCCISGTASNGVDYQSIGNFVSLPGGVLSNNIVIKPINLGQTDIRTVKVDLCPSPLMTPVNYSIGSPSSATAYLTPPDVSNLPPKVTIVNPANGAAFYAPTNISLIAKATDSNGSIVNVEFFAGTTDLGPGIPVVLDPPGVNGVTGPVYFLNWQNVPANAYSLTAVATENDGLSTTSAPVNITVLTGPPPTNRPPVVEISWPTNGATFFGRIVCPPCVTNNPPCELPCYFVGPDITICASASDPDDFVATVEFFANGHSLGTRTNCPACANPINPFCLVWSNLPPANSYSLTAVATDNGGLSTTSAPVNITVLAGPPPTNRPPVVRITSPPNGAVFRAPVNIPIFSYAADPDGFVSGVEFFAGNSSLGFGRRVTAVPPPLWSGSVINPTNFWELTWTNPPLGTNLALTARATDNGSASTVSGPVQISILPSPPPPTNRPPLISIVATDPVAIEGTNCWPWPGLPTPSSTWSNWVAAGVNYRFFTNCGPKNATFTVFRSGATNDSLDVAYAIGGTATNGVDYVALPGLVTVPAGGRRAEITVMPLDDDLPDLTSTVILKLVPDTTGTNYLLGYPRAAAAIILDSQSPRAVNGLMPGAVFNISASGPDGAWFHVEYSSDMIHWTPVCTNQVVNGRIDFVDPDAATSPARFYRTVPEAGPPAQ